MRTLSQGWDLLAVGRAEAAGQLAGQVLAAEPDNAEALRLLACCYQRLSRAGEMLAAADGAAALTPADKRVHRLRASALMMLKRPPEAVAAARQAVACDPRDAWSHITLAEAHLAAGRTRHIVAARAAARQARQLAPELPAAWVAEGDAYLWMADFRRARAAYRAALRLDPENTAALYGLSLVDLGRGRIARSSRNVGGVLAATPTDEEVRKGATLGARAALWRLFDVSCLAVLGIAVAVDAARPAGAVAMLGAWLAAVSATAGLVRWYLSRLSAATLALIRDNLRRYRFTFVTAPLGVLLLFVGMSLSAATRSAPGLAVALATPPMLLFMLRVRLWLGGQVYLLVRRLWFRWPLHRLPSR